MIVATVFTSCLSTQNSSCFSLASVKVRSILIGAEEFLYRTRPICISVRWGATGFMEAEARRGIAAHTVLTFAKSMLVNFCNNGVLLDASMTKKVYGAS